MAQKLDAIIKELDAGYAPSRQLINQRIAALPGQADAEIAGLNAQKDQAFGDILGGARERGVAFGGIPLAEQARYSATNFLPAVARVRQAQNDQKSTLVGSLADINREQRSAAMGLREGQITRDEQRRQFNAQLQAQREAEARADARARRSESQQANLYKALYGGGGASGGGGMPAGMTERRNKLGSLEGYNFVSGGKPVSAATFAAKNKLPIGELLYTMGKSGDVMAQQAYNWMKSIQGTELFNSGRWKQTPAYQRFSPIFWGS